MHPFQRALSRAGIVAAVAAAIAPAAAQADSIVFVKDHDVWLAEPDGSNQHQVTTDGTADNPYTSPSQADDGTIVTVRAQPNNAPLLRLKQNGELLGEIPLPPMVAGPFNPHVSPDGALVAYEEVNGGTSGWLATEVYYTRTDQYTPRATYGSPGRGARGPSWIDSGRAFVGVSTGAVTHAPGQAAAPWWDDYDHWDWFGGGADLKDGEYAAGTAVLVRGWLDEDNELVVYRGDGGFTSLPTPTCRFTDPAAGPNGRRFADPTLSPTASDLWWQEGDGIWTAALPSGTDCSTIRPRLAIPGASEPDWGPAPVAPGPRPTPVSPTPDPAPAPVPAPRRGTTPAPRRGTTPTPRRGTTPTPRRTTPARGDTPTSSRRGTTRARGSARLTVAGTRTLATALQDGLRVRLAGLRPGARTRVQVRAGRRVVASGRGRADARGNATVRVRFTRAARRSLAGKQSARLTLHAGLLAGTVSLRR